MLLAVSLMPPAAQAQNDYPTYQDFEGDPGNIILRDAEDGLPETVRYRGTGRHDTAGQIATDDRTYVDAEGFRDADEVVLARADEFPDALAGSYLAGIFDAPILLVDTSGPIEPNTRAALEVIDPDVVTVLGQTDAISNQAAQDAAAVSGAEINRIGGTTRFETAEQIAGVGDVAELDGQRTVFLATGLEFADALVAGQIASFEEHPILLTTPDSLHSAADRALDAQNVDQVIILGQTAAISAQVEAEVEAKGIETMRVGDADRAGTATMVAQLAIDVFDFDPGHMSVATGFTFPDALTIGPHAGEEAAPLFLTRGTTFLDGADDNQTQPSEFLEQYACETGSIHIAGGHDAIALGLEDQIRAHSDCPPEPVEPEPETITVTVDPETQTVSEPVTATAEVIGDDGEPFEGAEVEFSTEHGEDGEVTALSDEVDATDDEGVATFEFTTPETGTVTVTGETNGLTDDATATFVEAADDDTAAAGILDADFERTLVFVEGSVVAYDWSEGEEFYVDGDAVSQEDWESALADLLAEDAWLSTVGYADDERTTEFHLGSSPEDSMPNPEQTGSDATDVTEPVEPPDQDVVYYRVQTRDPGGEEFDVRDVDQVLWIEDGEVTDVTDPEGAEALYLHHPDGPEEQRIHDSTVSVYYDMDGDGEWWELVADFNEDGDLTSVNGHSYPPDGTDS